MAVGLQPVNSSEFVIFPALYPAIVRLPGSSVVEPLVTDNTLYSDVVLQLNSAAWEQGHTPYLWWTVQAGNDTLMRPDDVIEGGLALTTVSDRIAPTFITSSFDSYGVIAIYVTVQCMASPVTAVAYP